MKNDLARALQVLLTIAEFQTMRGNSKEDEGIIHSSYDERDSSSVFWRGAFNTASRVWYVICQLILILTSS